MTEHYEGPTQFFAVADRRTGRPLWIAAWGTPKALVYAWVSNDNQWHQHSGLFGEFFDRDQAVTFTEITAKEAVSRSLSWPPLRIGEDSYFADRLLAAPTASPADLGLPER